MSNYKNVLKQTENESENEEEEDTKIGIDQKQLMG